MNGEAIDIAKCPARSLSEIAYLVCRGGWPVVVGQHGDMALEDVGEVCRVAVAEPRGDLGGRRRMVDVRSRTSQIKSRPEPRPATAPRRGGRIRRRRMVGNFHPAVIASRLFLISCST